MRCGRLWLLVHWTIAQRTRNTKRHFIGGIFLAQLFIADQRIFTQALLRLFENNPDPIHVIKWKNIIEVLESATDKCEDVGNVIESIMLKYA